VSFQINEDPRVAIFIGTEGVTQYPGALVAQIVLAALEGILPGAALEQDDAESRGSQLLGDNAAACARSDYHRVDMF
jgi:hypothetical protein